MNEKRLRFSRFMCAQSVGMYEVNIYIYFLCSISALIGVRSGLMVSAYNVQKLCYAIVFWLCIEQGSASHQQYEQMTKEYK